MCGLYGFTTTKPNKKNIQAVRALGLLMQDRGSQSTGLAVIKGENAEIIKDAKSADEFFNNDLIIDPSARAVIGHTRYATTGAVNKENAHPFQYGRFVGAHNGVLSNHADVGNFTVDSQAIFYLLEKYSGDFQRAFSELSGSMAISWTNGYNIYLVKHQNPLAIAVTDNTLFWASEIFALRVIMESIGETSAIIEEMQTDQVLAISPTFDFRFIDTHFKKPKPVVHTQTAWQNYKKKKKHESGNNYVYGAYNSGGFREYTDEPLRNLVPVSETVNKKVITQTDSDALEELIEEGARDIASMNGCSYCGKCIDQAEVFYFEFTQGKCYHKGNCFQNLFKSGSDSFKLIEL